MRRFLSAAALVASLSLLSGFFGTILCWALLSAGMGWASLPVTGAAIVAANLWAGTRLGPRM